VPACLLLQEPTDDESLAKAREAVFDQISSGAVGVRDCRKKIELGGGKTCAAGLSLGAGRARQPSAERAAEPPARSAWPRCAQAEWGAGAAGPPCAGKGSAQRAAPPGARQVTATAGG